VNVIGDHATTHRHLDAPLTSDVEAVAAPFSHWVRTTKSSRSVGRDAAEAVSVARSQPGRIASLILPADASWNEPGIPAKAIAVADAPMPPDEIILEIAKRLSKSDSAIILMSGMALREGALEIAAAIAKSTGARLLTDTFYARLERGGDRAEIARLPYFTEQAVETIADASDLILVHTAAPVGFFAYPDKPSIIADPATRVHTLAQLEEDAEGALQALAEALGIRSIQKGASRSQASRPDRPTGELNPFSLAAAIGSTLRENMIVVDESTTGGLFLLGSSVSAPSHDWLSLTGGAIGMGMPAATGAALACPNRRVVNVESDGSAMYTLQALWTQARESLDVTTVILANRSYAILNMELVRTGAAPSKEAERLFDLGQPDLDFVSLARGLGVPGVRVEDAESLVRSLEASYDEPGPQLIEVVL
jgi:acetolactate synthase-1/2/3 large subunit